MIARVVCCVAFATVSGCYSPAYIDCQVTCATGMGCPSGLMCDTSVNACRQPDVIGRACGAVGSDGGIDAPVIDAEICSTWHGIFPASNFDPCNASFPKSAGSLAVPFGLSWTFDTDHMRITDGNGTVTSAGGPYNGMWAIHYSTVEIDGLIDITGSTPLLIVADDAMTITSTIDGTMATPAEESYCSQPNGTTQGVSGAGGGGGGYGSPGGNGGLESNGVVAMGESANGSASLVPLRFGCAGGTGGSPDVSVAGGAGGTAGAAFELVSAVSITTSSASNLEAGGGGGGGGNSTGSLSSGGGGGGTGGSILLEAPTLSIGGAVCAPGGGGGQGGPMTLPAAGANGGHGTCSGGQGGDGGQMTGPGGAGADNNSPSGLPGTMGDSAGGGGGGVGRLHFHAITLTMGAGTICPAPQ